MTGAAAAVDCLRRSGVTRVFGIPAIETTDLFAAFQGSSVEMILVTHESTAAQMADAHARVTGELSACVLTPGPGLTNALSGIAQARLDSSPMILLVASGAASYNPGQGILPSSLDHLAGAPAWCKGVLYPEEPEEVPTTFSRAVRWAREGEPGPVLLEIPGEVQRAEGRMEGTGFRPGPRVLSDAAALALEKTSEMIKSARSVGIYAGAGCFEAAGELAEMAERLQAPVACTVSGLGVLPYIHKLAVGFGPGPMGAPLCEKAFARCDLVLAIGCRMSSEIATNCLNPGSNLVHIDVEPGIGQMRPNPDVTVKAPSKLAFRALLDRLEDKSNPGMRDLIRLEKRELRKAIEGREEWTDVVDPVKFFRFMREVLSSEDVLVLDSGRHAFFGIGCYPVHAPRTLLAPVDYRTLGFAVPAAVAVKLAQPERRVVGCVGDGGFLLTGLELLTARRCNVAPVVVVFAEGPMDSIRSVPPRVMGRETCFDLVPVNYEELAHSLDVGYIRILRDNELESGLTRALTTEAPVIVEMRVSYREVAAYLKRARRVDWQNLPGAVALRLGSRLVVQQILEGATSAG
jgi:acetolactate synthase-1/2/3 large subunit